jgi:hypothetical protein
MSPLTAFFSNLHNEEKKMSKKYHVQRREFLNRLVDLPAYAIAIVEDTREIAIDDVDSWKWGEIKLIFSDCYRNISFDFDLSNPAERENSLHKIRLIAEVVSSFLEALEIEAAAVEERLSFLPLAKAATTIQ